MDTWEPWDRLQETDRFARQRALQRERCELTQAQQDRLSALARITMNLPEARHREIAIGHVAVLAQVHLDPVPAPAPPTPSAMPPAARR